MFQLKEMQNRVRSWFYTGALLSFIIVPACIELEPAKDPYIVTFDITVNDDGYSELKGSIINIGINELTDHGFCWSGSPNPTIDDEVVELGALNSAVSFYGSAYELLANTSYYFRAFARTGNGIFYGNQVTYRTPAPTNPIVTTGSFSELTDNSVQVRGEVLFSGGDPILDRGVSLEYLSEYPTIEDQNTNDSIGIGEFISSISGLTPNTTYHFRAYATNGVGTGYGEDYIIKTYSGTITDIDGNSYGTLIIGSQTWMGSNLKVTHYANGTEIPLAGSSSQWGSLEFGDKAYCWYSGEEETGNVYGALYNWAAAMNGEASSGSNPSGVQGACPDGWHLPVRENG